MTRRRDEERWPGLDGLFAHVPLPDTAKDALYSMMSAPERVYHGTAHLALLWDRHERYAVEAGFAGAHATTLVACAIAFHDCVYKPARRDNEARSAEIWLEASDGCGLAAPDRAWVADTIRATADHLAYTATSTPERGTLEALRFWVLDLDLTPFGESPSDFDRNTTDLRREHQHLSSAQWESNRLRMLRRCAAAPAIYRNSVLAAAFERRARHNIERQLAAAGPVSATP